MAMLKDILGSCSRNHGDNYQECFDSIDSDRDGRILGDESKEFFSMTDIDNHQLKKVDKVTSKVDGLKQLYIKNLKPLEVAYHYDVFASPLLTNADFDAKPMVMFLGKYSTGKTTFIEYFLGGNYPGAKIGLEPTTDKFTVIMDGPVERTVKGRNIAGQEDMPFKGLTSFGDTFLSTFECSQMPNPILEHITVVDTPGLLGGNTNRRYDFAGVIKWFAEKCDLIILMFDPYSIDISNEFKGVITSSLRGQDHKIRVVLNKADQLDNEQLIRICSALTLSIGMVLNNPSPMHIYTGSFNRRPVNNLFAKEEHDLRLEMKGIAELVVQNQIEKFRKRARSAKLHAYIIGQLKKEMPVIGMRGKAKAQEKLVQKLEHVFEKVLWSLRIPASDFPDVEHFRKVLDTYKINKFKKLKPKLIKPVDEILETDIGELLEKFKNPF